jgi:AAA family ATP:ADP antiporter
MSDRPHPEREEEPIGGGVMAGFVEAVRSPYLLNTAIFLLLYAVTSTFLYFSQASVVSESFTSRGAQTAFFATIDLSVNVITLVVQIFFTGRLVRWLGVAVVLGLLPALSMLGFGAIAVVPTLAAVASFQVLRRAGNYALSQPARQVLYTVVSREDRYKAKNFIDNRGVPRRRPGGSLVLCARRIYWLGDQGSRHHRYCAFGAMARQQPLARQTTGNLGRTAGGCRAEQC